jgi:hypothetical protein
MHRGIAPCLPDVKEVGTSLISHMLLTPPGAALTDIEVSGQIGTNHSSTCLDMTLATPRLAMEQKMNYTSSRSGCDAAAPRHAGALFSGTVVPHSRSAQTQVIDAAGIARSEVLLLSTRSSNPDPTPTEWRAYGRTHG